MFCIDEAPVWNTEDNQVKKQEGFYENDFRGLVLATGVSGVEENEPFKDET